MAITDKQTKLLQKLFYKEGLMTVKKIKTRLKQLKETIKETDIKDFIENQESYQIQKQPTRTNKKNFRPIVAYTPHELWMIDLLDTRTMNPLKNKGYKYIMTVVDVFSRYAFTEPIKNKTTKSTAEAFEKIIKRADRPPDYIQSDNGNEYKREFKKVVEKYNIDHNYVIADDHRGQGIIERFNQTLRDWIEKVRTSRNTQNWTAMLEPILNVYNNTEHSTTKMSPKESLENKDKQFFLLQERLKDVKDVKKYNVGDSVRVLIKKGIFEKGATAKWSKEIHKIEKKNGNRYYVNDDWYKYSEIQKIDKDKLMTNPFSSNVKTRTDKPVKTKNKLLNMLL
jgi:hypothetical protein